MAVVIESIQNDLHKMNMERMRILATLLATFLDIKNRQMETNTQLQNVNYFINLMEEARQKGGTEMPVDISTYQADMRPEITSALDARGIKYVMMPGPNGDYIMTDSSPETRQAINAIRMGTDKIIAGATCVVALDSGVFGAQNNNRKCTMYTDLNKQQVMEFKRLAQENGFQFGLSQVDGKYAVAVTNDVAERYHLNQFAHECATFNKSGLFNAYQDLEALQARRMQDKFWEDSQNKPTQDVVYVDLNSPSHYIEVVNDKVTVHTPTGSETFPADKTNLQDVLGKASFSMENGAANYVAVSKAEFMATYKAGPLDNDARMAFVAAERELSTTRKHSIMIEQIARMSEKSPALAPLDSMAKVFADRAQQMPEGSDAKQILSEFAQAHADNDRTKMNQMVMSGQLAGVVGRIESQMIQKAMNGNMTPTEFVYATVMASAEREALRKGDVQVADALVANAFNTKNISTMLKSQDAVAAGLATAQNPKLASKLTTEFSQAVQAISGAELRNNISFMSDIRETMQVLRHRQTLENMIETANVRGDTKLAEMLQQGTPDAQAAKIALIASGMSPVEAGFTGLDSKVAVEQFLDVFERASDKAIENPTVSLTQLSKSPSISDHYGKTMFADVVSRAALQDMIVAEKMVSRTEIEGADIAGALDEANITGNDDRSARSSADPELNSGTRGDDMDMLDL